MLKNEIIEKLIEINAIKLNPANPFTWASGWRSPIYCDNRKILSYPDVRKLVCEGLKTKIHHHFKDVEVIAGVATGAIAHGVLVAEALNLPFIYVRSSPKQHGLENLIEGELAKDKRVVVIEDLISTGLSSLKAVDAIRNAGAKVLGMLSIFTYSFKIAEKNFAKKDVEIFTLADYEQLIRYALKAKQITNKELELLEQWRIDPENWGNLFANK
ncbi:MAG: orotate phosphoribosyltransferase [Bacteroidales bacterium]|nr:orotate phosphoribosyltransferase [Bacteroidales bacterium]